MEKKIVEKPKEACDDLQVQLIVSEDMLNVMNSIPVEGKENQMGHLQAQAAIENQLNVNKLTLANLKTRIKKEEI